MSVVEELNDRKTGVVVTLSSVGKFIIKADGKKSFTDLFKRQSNGGVTVFVGFEGVSSVIDNLVKNIFHSDGNFS